jgi:hypothetical protein
LLHFPVKEPTGVRYAPLLSRFSPCNHALFTPCFIRLSRTAPPIFNRLNRCLFRACSLALSGRNKAISRRVYAVFIRAGLKVKAGLVP